MEQLNGENDDLYPAFINDPEVIREEFDRLKALWLQLRQRSHDLQMKEATLGLNADPSVTMEIRNLTKRMQDVANQYRALLQRFP